MPVWKSILPALLTVLLTLMACSDPTPAPTNTPAPTQAPAPTPRSTATPTPAPTEPSYAPGDEPGQGAIIPLMLDDSETFASEVSDSELACMAGTADIERLSRILFGTEEPTPAEFDVIRGCLRDEIILRMFLGGFVQDLAPLSLETVVCIRAGFEGIDFRSAMLAAILGNEPNDMDVNDRDMLLASVFVIIPCLNDEEWETAATVLDMDPGTRAAMMCLLEEIGGTEGMTAALEAWAEGSLTALLLAATGCGLETEEGTEPAATLVITIAPIPADIPEYDRDDWKHWTDADGDCQDAREEVLVEESLDEVTFETDQQCRVESGRWFGAFTGVYVEDPGDLDIDHMVPLRNVHYSGGWDWRLSEKRWYANFLFDDDHLIAVASRANRSKGARGPEEWKPRDETCWCEYARSWAEIKARWELTMTEPEADAVKDMLGTCETPVRVVTESGEEMPLPTTEQYQGPVYGSWEEAESARGAQGPGEPGRRRGIPEGDGPVRAGRGRGSMREMNCRAPRIPETRYTPTQ